MCMDDALPNLHKLRALGHRFDLVLLSAVSMHVPPAAGEGAFRIISELLKPSGVLVITLRHVSDEQWKKGDEKRGRNYFF